MEHADDDLMLDRRYPQHYRRAMKQIDDDIPPFTSFESMLRILDSLTNRNFLIIFTIFVILIFQFRERILGWVSDLDIQQRGFFAVCLDIWETIAFYLRTIWNMLNIFISVPDSDGLQQQQQTGSQKAVTRRARGRHASMPDLEGPAQTGDAAPEFEPRKKGQIFSTRIEPAFLDPKQYPPGWLVYDPKLGVISKDYKSNGCSGVLKPVPVGEMISSS